MNPTQSQVALTFEYRNGSLYRKTSARRGYLLPDGYVYTRLKGKSYGEHRLVHLLFTGQWPEQVDHINRNRSDNRPENLRSVSNSENSMNRKQLREIPKGCYWQSKRKKWMVQIGIAGKQKTLGYFEKLENAREAYMKASIKFHGEFSIY